MVSAASNDRRLKGYVGAGVRSAVSRFYPDYVSENDVFADCVARNLKKDSIVLDAGCGSGIFFPYSWKQRVRFLVGCDMSSGLTRNANLTSAVSADLRELPFATESFDLIFSRYVLEHLDSPQRVFDELARVLKPGGKLIVLTPSKYHYVTFVGNLTPHWFHEIVGRVRGNSAHDIFPTRFRANTKSQIISLAGAAGLSVSEFITTEARPNYLMWSLPSFLVGVMYERTVNRFNALDRLRSSIIATLKRE